jgi:PAS domain S-box-containing protein
MEERIHSLDWSETPLGPIENWSEALKTTVRIVLANRFPMLLWWGPEYISIYNDAYVPILGQKHPWGLGKPVRECWSEIWDVLKPLIDTPFQGGPATWSEDIELHINRSGFTEETHFTIAYSPVPDETEQRGIGGVLATVHEITAAVIGQRRSVALRDLASTTEARTASEACADAASKLAMYSKDIPFALIYLSPKDGNATLAASTGVEIENVKGILEIFAQAHGNIHLVDLPPGFVTTWREPWPESPAQAAILPIRSHLPQQVAGLVVAGLSPRLRFDESYSDFLKLVTSQIATAISNACAYEEERKRADALAEIDRVKTAFFSNVSHEFRTPLTLMLGPMESMLKDTGGLTPAQREQTEIAYRNSLRLLKLVNSLLDFSRLEAGRAKAFYTPNDLSALTRELASNFSSALQVAGLDLIVRCAPLPEPVYVDLEMWEKIVLNLLSNAFKFTFTGKIEVTLEAAGKYAVLRVSDTGIGIPSDELPHIFERFHRVEGARGRSCEGTGIGLALVQGLVKMHGGFVAVESDVGRGSTFSVRIPFGKRHLPQDRLGDVAVETQSFVRTDVFVEEALRWLPENKGAASVGRQVSADVPPGTSAPRVLLAEDNADMRDYIVRLLAPDMLVTAVTNGQEALALAIENPPDLVLSDVMMPMLDGFGLLGELKRHAETSDVPVILLSARAGEESRIEGVSAGADDYLVKPFSGGELVARVNAHLKLARERHQSMAAMRRLQEISTKLVGESDLRVLLGEFLDAGMEIVRADMGNVQLVDPLTSQLKIVAQRGLDRPFLDFFSAVREGMAACGTAMRDRERFIVDDAATSPVLDVEARKILLGAGVRAVQSTPFITRSGKFLGMLSTHFHSPGRPPDRDLQLLDVLARQAADLIENSMNLEALRASEERLTMAIEAAGMGTWDVNLRDGKARWSRRRFEILGYKPEVEADQTIEHWRKRVHPEDLAGVDRAIERARSSGERYTSEHRIIRADNGQVRWVAEIGRCIYGKQREPERFIGLSFDVTDRVQATRSSLLLSAIVDSSDDAIISKNLEGVITSWNKGAERLFGYRAEEAVGQTVAALLIPADRQDEELKILARLARGERVDHFETMRRRKNGELLDISLTISPVMDDRGHIAGASKIARDITESKRAEQALRQSEERFRQLAEGGPQIVWLYGPQGELEFVNRRWVEFSGLDLEATRDRNQLRLRLHSEDALLAHWQRCLSSGTPLELEARLMRKNGEFRWFLIRSVPVKDETGQIQRWLTTSTDIHDGKLLQLELTRANQDLEQFAYSASHDLQEPLRSVKIFSELLCERHSDGLGEQALEFLGNVRDSANRMEMLVRDLLAYTQATRDDITPEPVDANDPLQAALANLAGAVTEANASISWDPLPFVKVPATHLQQIFQNLIGNAIKYHSPGIPPVVHVTARREDGMCTFSVQDNGIGIEPEYREKIFGLFKRLHTRDEYSGTGIGLALCQRIIGRHHGRIWVESKAGTGSTFHFTLPV